jgi:hypothetical protein
VINNKKKPINKYCKMKGQKKSKKVKIIVERFPHTATSPSSNAIVNTELQKVIKSQR